MGYTHYSYRVKKDFDYATWDAFIADCKLAVKHFPKTIENGYTGNGKQYPLVLNGCFKYKTAKFTKEMVHFNGGENCGRSKQGDDGDGWSDTETNDLGHETFHLSRKYQKSYYEGNDDTWQFSCCKTAYKPYDFAVMVVMLLYKSYFKADVKISSDGEWEQEWKPAREFIAQHFPTIAFELELDGCAFSG